jgi:hypothetical protein
MLATKMMTTKEHVNGHYEVTHTLGYRLRVGAWRGRGGGAPPR